MSQKFSLTAGGHRLFYQIINHHLKRAGQPVLVFLHEGLGCIDKWKDFPLMVSDSLQMPALVYDRYGYGYSDALEEARKPDFLHVEALTVLPEILDKLGISEDLILIGHSDGGSIALIYASVFPERVRGLVLEAPHVLVEEIAERGLQSAVMSYNYSDLKERLVKYHGDHTDSTFWGWVNVWTDPENRNWNIESCLPSIKAPVLFIQGADDEYGTVAQLEAIRKGVKGTVEAEIIPGCGHVPHQQAEALALKRMISFISHIR